MFYVLWKGKLVQDVQRKLKKWRRHKKHRWLASGHIQELQLSASSRRTHNHAHKQKADLGLPSLILPPSCRQHYQASLTPLELQARQLFRIIFSTN